jgi:hypothetical protein
MDPATRDAVTRELRAFVREAGRRRSLTTTCRVGRPDGERVSLPHVDTDDLALRTDLVVRALDGLLSTDGACAWVTRGGSAGTVDADAAWFAAARAGFASHGLRLPAFLVLHRYGWVDLVSGDQRRWLRVRQAARPGP